LGETDEELLLELLGAGDVHWDVGVERVLKVWAPPLADAIANLPLLGGVGVVRLEEVVEDALAALNLLFSLLKPTSWSVQITMVSTIPREEP
jgi:hypothetical protein